MSEVMMRWSPIRQVLSSLQIRSQALLELLLDLWLIYKAFLRSLVLLIPNLIQISELTLEFYTLQQLNKLFLRYYVLFVDLAFNMNEGFVYEGCIFLNNPHPPAKCEEDCIPYSSTYSLFACLLQYNYHHLHYVCTVFCTVFVTSPIFLFILSHVVQSGHQRLCCQSLSIRSLS